MIVRTDEIEPETAWLSALLDAEAESYTPDSGRLSASVYERLAAARTLRTRAFTVPIRLAGVPVGVAAAALCATVAMAVTATVGGNPPTPGSSPTPSPMPDPTATAPQLQNSAPPASLELGTGSIGNRPAVPGTTATATRTITVAGAVDGGDNTAWSQEKVIVSLTQPATAFELTVKVATGPKVAPTGSWMTYSPNLVDVSVETRPDGIYYTFRLKPGQVLPIGNGDFGVQYTHDATHESKSDTYHLTSNSDQASGGPPTTLQGTF